MNTGRWNYRCAVALLCIAPFVWHSGETALADAPPQSVPATGHQSQDELTNNTSDDHAKSKPASLRNDVRVRRWWFTMGWGLVLIITFLAGSAAIIVFSRRFRALLKPNRPNPTPDGDVWAMHVAPPTDDDAFAEFENADDDASDLDDDDDESDDEENEDRSGKF